MAYPKIRFLDREFIMVEQAITTPEDYVAGRASYAHLFDDGVIKRFGVKIGEKVDIVFTGDTVDCEPDMAGFLNMFFDPSWVRRV